jgi:hypothetical protein
MKQRNAVPENNTRNNSLAISVWREWVENRNMQPETAVKPGYPIPVEIDKSHSFADMDFWLKKIGVKMKNHTGLLLFKTLQLVFSVIFVPRNRYM